MERYVTEDGSVAKYVHDDGSETSIKTWPKGMESCGGSGREKFNVFISVSSGCPVKCKFCFLTTKGYPYYKLEPISVSENVTRAIEEEFKYRPYLKDIPMNLSFMGMGDAWFDLVGVEKIVSYILSWFPHQKIEGVDIATTLPVIRYSDKKHLKAIEKRLNDSGNLVDRPKERTCVRVFYSLVTKDSDTRKKLIPNSIDVEASMIHLELLKDHFNVILHTMILDGVNDDATHIYKTAMAAKFGNYQLRVLRYNKCPNSSLDESKSFEDVIDFYKSIDINFKYQISPGKEVYAACGMFLMNKER